MNISVAAQNIVLLDALGQVIQALQRAGVSALVLKGAALAETVYPSIAERPMADLDLLVREEEIEAAAKCLRDLGYLPSRNEDCVFSKITRFHVRLDLHYQVWYLAAEDFRRLWDESQPFSIAQTPARTLPADEALIYTLAHAAIEHGTLGPVVLEDISRLCSFYRQSLDWDRIVEKIEKYNLQLPLYYALSAARELKAAPIPAKALGKLKPSSFRARLTEKIYQYLVAIAPTENIGHLLKLLSQRGLRAKLRFFWKALFPSRAFIARRYNLYQPILIRGYQCLRPGLQLIELLKLLLRCGRNIISRRLFPGKEQPGP